MVCLPGGYTKIGQVGAGIGLYSDTNLAVSPTQYVGYAVLAVASNGLAPAQAPANRFMADGAAVDTDGDGIPDWWKLAWFGDATGQASEQSFAWNDPAGDGLSNLQKYLLRRNPLVWDSLQFVGCQYLADGRLRLTVFGQAGLIWTAVTNFISTNAATYFRDTSATNYSKRFYRAVAP